MTKQILLASHNAHKKEEIGNILGKYGYTIIGLDDLNDNFEPEENGLSFKENAYIKAKYYNDKYNIPTISDDSGISIKYFLDLPHIHSARFLNHLDYPKKNKLICQMMKDVKNREAYYSCVICLIDDDVHYFEGIMNGYINDVPLGDNGFGYDPIFYLKEYDKTLGQIDALTKNKISHRSKALEGLVNYLENK